MQGGNIALSSGIILCRYETSFVGSECCQPANTCSRLVAAPFGVRQFATPVQNCRSYFIDKECRSQASGVVRQPQIGCQRQMSSIQVPRSCPRRYAAHRLVWHAAVFLTACYRGDISVSAEPKSRLIEMKDDTSTYVGKVISKSHDHCHMMDRFGVLRHLPISRLKSFEVMADSYRPSSTGEFRQQLQSEIQAGYEIQTSAHYMVAAKKGRAKVYATLFEEIFRQVGAFYSIRGFETTAPELTLIAIVFSTEEEFKEYCGRDEVLWSKELRGYYSLRSNRVALFDDPSLQGPIETTATPRSASDLAVGKINPGSIGLSENSGPATASFFNGVACETANTITHEATHQVGYNIGIHSRMAETPTWVIEGLATVLEAPGVRTRDKATALEKVNVQRLEWFHGEYASRRQPGDLAKMIADDAVFRNQALDAYSAAWALTYFMTENPARSRLFVRYLRLLGERDPLKDYNAKDRLKDFQSIFGDIARLEIDFLRSIDHIENP